MHTSYLDWKHVLTEDEVPEWYVSLFFGHLGRESSLIKYYRSHEMERPNIRHRVTSWLLPDLYRHIIQLKQQDVMMRSVIDTQEKQIKALRQSIQDIHTTFRSRLVPNVSNPGKVSLADDLDPLFGEAHLNIQRFVGDKY